MMGPTTLEPTDKTRLNNRDKRFFPQELEVLSVRSYISRSRSRSKRWAIKSSALAAMVL